MIRKSGGGTNVTGTGVPRAFGIAQGLKALAGAQAGRSLGRNLYFRRPYRGVPYRAATTVGFAGQGYMCVDRDMINIAALLPCPRRHQPVRGRALVRPACGHRAADYTKRQAPVPGLGVVGRLPRPDLRSQP
jgi:hypothetical protein